MDDIEGPHSCFLLREQSNPEILLTELMRLHFLEMPKLRPGVAMRRKLLAYLTWFRHKGAPDKEEMVKIAIKDYPESLRADDLYQQFTADGDMTERLEARLKWERDESGRMDYAKRMGAKEGDARGEKMALFDAIEELRRKGMALEEIQATLEISEEMMTEFLQDCGDS